MNIFYRFPDPPKRFSLSSWPYYILLTSVLCLIDIEPVMKIPPSQAKDVEVGKPTIQKSGKPKVLEEKLENRPIAKPWKPGDPIHIRPDLKRSDVPPGDEGTDPSSADNDPDDGSTEKP